MIFSELYSAYYNAVAKILTDAVNGEIGEKTIQRTVFEHAFSESVLTILPALKSERWQLLHRDMSTPLINPPTMPLTTLEKRWLKSILGDPRISLFGISIDGLDDVTPLFTEADYTVFDKYADGDPYGDQAYRERFSLILEAIKYSQPLKIELLNRNGKVSYFHVIPERLEYSEKDDKFRLISSGCKYGKVINLGRILNCKKYYGDRFTYKNEPDDDSERELTLEITDDRNALERVLLHFAHFEKRAENANGNKYTVSLKYHKDDETEIVIRVLSFGPRVRVVAPSEFRELIRNRLISQKRFLLK